MPSRGRETFLAGLVIVGFLVLLYGGIWFFTPAPHRETIMLPYAKHAVSVSGRFAKSDVILVAGGCGVGFHRGPYGYCVPNGPVVAPPVVVAPRVCPPGYYLGPHGRRCWPVGVNGPPPGHGPPPPGYGPPSPGYGPPPGDGQSAGYGPPPRGNPGNPPPNQNSPPPPPPGKDSPPPGPETGPPPNE
jgi:hypothetical protein